MAEMIFSAEGIARKYRAGYALRDFNMQIAPGEIYGFVGENGAGKTTLIRLLAGLDFATEGRLTLFGKSGEKELLRQRKRLGFLIENPALHLDMTAEENMELIRIQRGIPGKACIGETLELLGLGGTGRKRVRNFSLGMRQRLGIAAALIGGPEFLVLDEPVNGLDPTGMIEVRELLKRLNRERGVTILISSHILAELDQLATRFGFIHKGRMLETLSAGELSEKCRRHLLIRVQNPEKAAALLETQFHTEHFEIFPDKSIHAYDLLERTEQVAACFAENGVALQEMTVRGDNLETYFTKLIGGAV